MLDKDTNTAAKAQDSISKKFISQHELSVASARKRLSKDIKALIKPTQRSVEKPPFSAGELVVFALVRDAKVKKQRCISKTEILQWILDTFAHYSQAALRLYAISQTTRTHHLCKKQAVPGFNEAFLDHNMPLRVHSGKTEDCPVYSTNPSEARVFLSSRLEQQRQGHFPFLELPAEMRNSVYEGVFHVAADTGLNVKLSHLDPPQLSLSAEQYSNGALAASPESYRARTVVIPRSKQTLALLFTCKQICQEAKSIFYVNNKFFFTNTTTLAAWSTNLSCPRIKHLTRVGIDLGLGYRSDDSAALSGAVQALNAMKGLVECSIKLHYDDLLLKMSPNDRKALGRKTPYTAYKQIPGMLELARLASRVNKFEIDGDGCPLFRDFIAAEVERIKPTKSESTQQADTEEGTKSSKKRTKVSKKESASAEIN